mgnify:CR=1 FL=1
MQDRVDKWTSKELDYLYPAHCHYDIVVIMLSYMYVYVLMVRHELLYTNAYIYLYEVQIIAMLNVMCMISYVSCMM